MSTLVPGWGPGQACPQLPGFLWLLTEKATLTRVQRVKWGQWRVASQGICWDGTSLQTLGMREGV